MPELELFADYDRETTHSIFAPETQFTRQSGSWGLHGMVEIPDRPGDFVFFVTYGQEQAGHVFDEGITREGVLTWQSQPRLTLQSDRIRQLIAHDEAKNTIHLFLRTTKDRPYTYLGRLKYLSHDANREKPVYFQWQLLDWNINRVPLTHMGLELRPSSQATDENEPTAGSTDTPSTSGLVLTAPPLPKKPRSGVETHQFRTRKAPDYADQDARNRRLGYSAELAVLANEQEYLRAVNCDNLADSVRHVAAIEGDGAGYDILSWTVDKVPRYIEVKATQGGIETEFYLSRNEAAFSALHAGNYYLMRVFNFDPETQNGYCFELNGDINEKCVLEPLEYRVRVG